jgi:hypothetical protein
MGLGVDVGNILNICSLQNHNKNTPKNRIVFIMILKRTNIQNVTNINSKTHPKKLPGNH